MKTRVKQHIYVVVFWLMAKYLFSLYYSAAIVNQFHMSLYNSADSHGWVTHIFKVIAHMFKMLCVSLLSTWQIITRCRCVVWKSEPGETVGESPPTKKKRGTGRFSIAAQTPSNYSWAHEKKKKNMRTFLYCRSSTLRDETGISFRRKWRYNRKTLVCVCVRWRFHVCYFGQVKRRKKRIIYFIFWGLSLSLYRHTHHRLSPAPPPVGCGLVTTTNRRTEAE